MKVVALVFITCKEGLLLVEQDYAPCSIGAFAVILDDRGRVLLCHRRE
jgi:hypothetical protein